MDSVKSILLFQERHATCYDGRRLGRGLKQTNRRLSSRPLLLQSSNFAHFSSFRDILLRLLGQLLPLLRLPRQDLLNLLHGLLKQPLRLLAVFLRSLL